MTRSLRSRHHPASTSRSRGVRRPRAVGRQAGSIDPRRAGHHRGLVSGCVRGHVTDAGFSGRRSALRARDRQGVAAVRPDLLHSTSSTSGWRREYAPSHQRGRARTDRRRTEADSPPPLRPARARVSERTSKSEGGTSEARLSFSPSPALPGEERLHFSALLLQAGPWSPRSRVTRRCPRPTELTPMLASNASRRPRVSPLALTQECPEGESGRLSPHLRGYELGRTEPPLIDCSSRSRAACTSRTACDFA